VTHSVKSVWLKCLDACAGTDGAEILEFAVSVPLLMVIAIGVTDFGSAFNLKYKLHNAVGAGTRFASNQTTSDVTNSTPTSTTAVRDVIDNYLSTAKVNDCGLATAVPTKSGLTWTYTATTNCPGNGTLVLVVDRGDTFSTTGASPVSLEATRVTLTYPFQWRFHRVIKLVAPGANYAGVTQLTSEAVMPNLN
jgi:Flp pilus assembly protein TadG